MPTNYDVLVRTRVRALGQQCEDYSSHFLANDPYRRLAEDLLFRTRQSVRNNTIDASLINELTAAVELLRDAVYYAQDCQKLKEEEHRA